MAFLISPTMYKEPQINNKLVHYSTFKPLIVYTNSLSCKTDILKENKGKTGVYRWVNRINGKTYVGSYVNLSTRFMFYFSENYLTKILITMYSQISKTLLKNGLGNFDLEIL